MDVTLEKSMADLSSFSRALTIEPPGMQSEKEPLVLMHSALQQGSCARRSVKVWIDAASTLLVAHRGRA